MTFSFNLIDEHWIPCIRLDGTSDELGLRQVFVQAHQLREIRGDSPLETASLYRLLLAVLHRVWGPKGWSTWNQLWQHGKFDHAQLTQYLDLQRVHSRFELFDQQRPFYQAQDSRAGIKSVINLVLEMASGNNATLFDHHTEDGDLALTPAQASRALVTAQAFGIGGLSGLPEKFTDAPCAKGIVFLASGESVFEILMLNLVRYQGNDPIPNDPDDCPAWERDDPFEPERTLPQGYLDYLTWQNRRIWLFPESTPEGVVVKQMCWAPGLRLDVNDIDPMKHYLANKEKGVHPLSFNPERALWRDSATLFRLADPKDQTRAPKVVKWLADLANQGMLEMDRQYQLMALGMAKNRASVDFFRSEQLPVRPVFLTDETQLGNLSSALELAEGVGSLLQWATFTLARLILHPTLTDEKLKGKPSKEASERIEPLASSWGAERYFWSGLELHFYRLVQDLPSEPQVALRTWRKQLRQAAHSAFDQAESYAGADRRAQRAVVKARDQFELGLNRILQERNQAVEVKTDDGN